MSANDMAMLIIVIGTVILSVILFVGLFSKEIVAIIKAIRGDKDD